MILIDLGWFFFFGGCQTSHFRFSTLCKFMEVASGSFVLKILSKLSIFVLGELFDLVFWLFQVCGEGIRPG